MKSLAEMLGSTLKHTGSAAVLEPIWRRVVGELVAGHSKPVRWDGPALVIRCDGEAWRAALESERPALGRKLAAALGESKPTPLVLEVG